MDDHALRSDLIALLKGGQAHITAEKALAGIEAAQRTVRPQNGIHSIYEEIEHMRLCQEDILRYTLDATWKSPPWPEGYWPTDNDTLSEEKWAKTISDFFSDLDELIQFVRETNLDLTGRIPHGEGRTYLREILLVADHNAYHLGQVMQTIKLLGN